MTGSTASVLVIETSACGVTGVVVVDESLSEFGSAVSDVAVAVFAIAAVVSSSTSAVTTIVTSSSTARSPREHDTVPPTGAPSCEQLTSSTVVNASDVGRTSLTWVFAAVLGPLLVTTSV